MSSPILQQALVQDRHAFSGMKMMQEMIMNKQDVHRSRQHVRNSKVIYCMLHVLVQNYISMLC